MSEEEKGFVIKDRRIFSEDRQEQGETGGTAELSEGKSSGKKQPIESDEASKPQAFEKSSPLPEINFATFVFSLNSSALVHLGMIEDPGVGKKEKNLPFAKQTIDILGMLEEKTKGNLSKDEENLLKNILHDLRLMYVKSLNAI